MKHLGSRTLFIGKGAMENDQSELIKSNGHALRAM